MRGLGDYLAIVGGERELERKERIKSCAGLRLGQKGGTVTETRESIPGGGAPITIMFAKRVQYTYG